MAEAWRRAGLAVDEVQATDPTPGTVVVRCPSGTLRVGLPGSGPDHAEVEEILLRAALGLEPDGPHVHPLPEGRRPPADADAVVLLAPIPLETVRATHAAGNRMPRKSTYFTPKPRSGLLLAELGGRRPPQPS